MTQFYVIEIQQYADGSYGDIRHIAYDENPDMARLKGESKYHEVLAAAAISSLPSHSATLMDSSGVCIMNQCYHHAVIEIEPEPEEPAEPENPEEETPTEEPVVEGE